VKQRDDLEASLSASLNSRVPLAGLSMSGGSPAQFYRSLEKDHANASTGVGGTGADMPSLMGKYMQPEERRSVKSSIVVSPVKMVSEKKKVEPVIEKLSYK